MGKIAGKLTKLRNDELHNLKVILQKLLITTTLMKRKKTECARTVIRMEETDKCKQISVGKYESKTPPTSPRRTWETKSQANRRETAC